MKKQLSLRAFLYMIYAMFYLVLFVVGYTHSGLIHWWIVVIIMAACHVAASFVVVGVRERALLIFLGKVIGPLESGPHFVPWPMHVMKVTKNSIKVDFGTLDPKDTDRVEKADPSMSWFVMKEPIRINWGDIKSSTLSADERKQYLNDPLAQRLTTDPHMYFIIRVYDLQRLFEEAGGIEEALDRIKDTCVTSIQEQAGQTFVARAVQEIATLSEKIRERVEDLVGDPEGEKRAIEANRKPNRSWGVDVLEVRVKDLGTPKRTNEAVADRSSTIARADGEATAVVLKAGSEKTRLQEEAEGQAHAKTTLAAAEKTRLTEEGEGQAAALRARGRVLETAGGELAAKLDTLAAGLQHGKTVILPMDNSLLTAALSINAALEATKDPKKGE